MVLLLPGDNIFKILSPFLHFCARKAQKNLGARKTPKMYLFDILGSKKGLFEGGKCAYSVIHLCRCITPPLEPNWGQSRHKKCKKARKKSKKKEILTSFWGLLAPPWVYLVARLPLQLFWINVSAKRKGVSKDLVLDLLTRSIALYGSPHKISTL